MSSSYVLLLCIYLILLSSPSTRNELFTFAVTYCYATISVYFCQRYMITKQRYIAQVKYFSVGLYLTCNFYIAIVGLFWPDILRTTVTI